MIHVSIIPSHSIALWLLDFIDNILDSLGLSKYQTIEEIIYFAIIVAASFAIGWIVRRIILLIVKKMVKMHDTEATRELLRQQTLTKCSHIIPPLVFLGLVPFAFESSASIHHIIIVCALVYTTVMTGIALSAILTFTFSRYNDKENKKNLPLRGVLNVGIGIVWGIVVIVSISIIVQKSPAALLGGLTAFAAVLMLVFKDSILGFVAGLQMSQNDMVHVGDWIVVPSTLANGVVEDVTLTTVKVRNFDNTLVMVPPYTLVSTCVQNWRGMSDSGMRRICEKIYINPDSIMAPTPEMLDDLSAKYPSIKAFIDRLKNSGQTVSWEKGLEPINGTIETNVGLFRAYLTSYLTKNDMINHDSDLMVYVTSPSSEGVPLQIYCFTITTQWEAYEAILSAVMEHALVQAPNFGLEILSADHLSIDTKGETEKATSVTVSPSLPPSPSKA